MRLHLVWENKRKCRLYFHTCLMCVTLQATAQTYRGRFAFPGQGYMQSFSVWTSARQQEKSETNPFRQETA